MGLAEAKLELLQTQVTAQRLRVSVIFSPQAGTVDEVELTLDAGSTVADALRLSELQRRHPGRDLSGLTLGVWGVLCEATQPLRDRDRIELYRPLTVDPKEARRLRFRANRAELTPADSKRAR